MGLESPISTLFDSNGTEMAYSQSQAITTGTTTGYLVMGSGSNGATFIKMGPSGEVFITGSIDAVAAGVQSITGTVNIGNQWAFTTGSNNALTVNQGQSGSIGQSWFVSVTDGTKVLGTGSSAPLYVNVVNSITSSTTSTTTVVSQVLAWTGSYAMLASNTARKGVSISKEGAGWAYVLFGSGTPSDVLFSVKLANNSFYEVPFNYTGPIKVSFSNNVATSFILVTDFS